MVIDQTMKYEYFTHLLFTSCLILLAYHGTYLSYTTPGGAVLKLPVNCPGSFTSQVRLTEKISPTGEITGVEMFPSGPLPCGGREGYLFLPVSNATQFVYLDHSELRECIPPSQTLYLEEKLYYQFAISHL